LRSFVDACQILVGHIDANAPESAAWLREILLRMLRATPHRATGHPSADVRVPRAVHCIEDRFAESTIHLAAVATAVDVSPLQLNRLLKEHTGLTFLQQLRRIRIRHADRLLLTTVASIREIAGACGYTSLARFGRDFQRAHGCAPRVWRAHRTLLDVPLP
jgi:transcriptional regulator GlxA family with amidase domain